MFISCTLKHLYTQAQTKFYRIPLFWIENRNTFMITIKVGITPRQHKT